MSIVVTANKPIKGKDTMGVMQPTLLALHREQNCNMFSVEGGHDLSVLQIISKLNVILPPEIVTAHPTPPPHAGPWCALRAWRKRRPPPLRPVARPRKCGGVGGDFSLGGRRARLGAVMTPRRGVNGNGRVLSRDGLRAGRRTGGATGRPTSARRRCASAGSSTGFCGGY